MKTLTATDARKKWFEMLKGLAKGHQIYRIASKEGDAVLLSEEDYASLLETLELLSVRGMLKSIRQAKKEIKEGKVYSMKEVFGD